MDKNPPITPYLLAGQLIAFTSLALPDRSANARPGRIQRMVAVLGVFAGGGLSAAGVLSLGSDLRATPLPAPGAALHTSGPYAITRHPIYTGLMITAGARALATGGRRHVISAIALAGILAVKARCEEQLLGANYTHYRNSVPRWGVGSRGRK